MKLLSTSILDCFIIEPVPVADERGFFSRIYCEREFSSHNINTTWVQANNSLSIHQYTLRGIHLQSPPFSEAKLIRCISGSLWDVIVDLRPSSPTFKNWYAQVLSAENRLQMYCPPGCGHGFLTLDTNTEAIYLVSAFYNSPSEQTLIWSDADIDIHWPLLPRIVSTKDQNGLAFRNMNLF